MNLTQLPDGADHAGLMAAQPPWRLMTSGDGLLDMSTRELFERAYFRLEH